jgi:aldose 1-epimerase
MHGPSARARLVFVVQTLSIQAFLLLLLSFSTSLSQDGSSPYHGAVVGRYANRIAGAVLDLDDGAPPHPLPSNNGPNCLHGGPVGWDKALWAPAPPARAPPAPPGGSALRLEHASPAGDQGFPGAVAAAVVYTLASDGCLRIAFEADLAGEEGEGGEGSGDAPAAAAPATAAPAQPAVTVVSMTQHAYFNLAGHGAGPVNSGAHATRHALTLAADAYTRVTPDAIPLPGPPAPVAGTPFDFRAGRDVGEAMADLVAAGGGPDGRRASEASQGGFDHNFCLGDQAAVTSPSWGPALRRAALLAGPAPGRRVLEVWTNAPGVQLYTANFLGGGAGDGAGEVAGKGGAVYARHGGLCLETQAAPDSPARPEWAAAVVLRRGGPPYRHTVEWRFGVGRAGAWGEGAGAEATATA